MRAATLVSLLLLGGISLHAADPAPRGAISYFNEACPDGWQPYAPAVGRAIVPSAVEGLNRAVGSPLAEGEEPRHDHKANVTLRLNVRTVYPDPSGGGAYVADWPPSTLFVRGDAEESSSALPLAKLNVCEKVEPPAGRAPAGMLFFFDEVACPDGWSPFRDLNGRVLTGAAPSDAVGNFGSLLALSDGEDRRHAHPIEGLAQLTEYTLGINAGCANCNFGWVRGGNYRYRGETEESSSGLPYLQLQACSKDAPVGPQISRAVHGADFQERALAVGQHATLFGNGMGPLEGLGAELLDNGEVARRIGGVEVLVDEAPAPLFFVRDDQINFQVPYEVVGRPSVSIRVVRDGIEGPAREVPLAEAAPALFAWGDEPGRAIAVYADGSLNSPDSPAEPGRPILLFATGGGQSAPPGVTGAPAEPPYPAPLGDVELWIGGEQATIDYAGRAPGFVGLMQINARMTAASGAVTVVLKVGGIETAVDTLIYGM